MSSKVAPGDFSVSYMRQLVRRLTASSSESELKTTTIDVELNDFILADFPYTIKLDQMRSVYEFYTQPNIDQYPLDVNFDQGVRAPVYVDGIPGSFYKDRTQFYNLWPKWPTKWQPIGGDGVTITFNFNIPAPFLRGEVTLGGVDKNGNTIQVNDDGNGNLQLLTPNAIISVPTQGSVYTDPPFSPSNPQTPVGKPIPGMYNINTQNPGLNAVQIIGSVNYVTGDFTITFPTAPAAGQMMNLFVSQYQTGKPYSLLFWNNYFVVRPVPKLVHKITVETYLTPVQFLLSSDVPILMQWAKYVAYGVSMEILRQRQDMEGVENLMEGFKRQEAMVLERQCVEEINQPNMTLFNSTTQCPGNVYGSQGWV